MHANAAAAMRYVSGLFVAHDRVAGFAIIASPQGAMKLNGPSSERTMK